MLALLALSSLVLSTCSGQGEEKVIIRELTVGGQEKMNISSRSLILTGNITVKNQSELLVTRSQIQMSIRGEKAYNVSTLDQGRVIMSNSTLETLSNRSIVEISGDSNMTLIDSNVKGFKAFLTSANTTLAIQGGLLDVRNVTCSGKAVSITDCSMPKGRLAINVTSATLERFKGDQILVNVNGSTVRGIECNSLDVRSVEPVSLNKSRVKHCIIRSDEEIVTADSTFDSLTLDSSGTAINVSTSMGGAGGSIQTGANATVRRYWYLKVNVTEMTGIGIPAKIIVDDYFGNTTLTGNAGPEGLYVKPVLAEIINSSKNLFVGNYKIRAEYLNHTTRYVPIVLDRNREIELRFTEPLPIESPTKLVVSPPSVYVEDPVKIGGWVTKGQPGEYVEIVAIGSNDSKIVIARRTGEGNAFEAEFRPQTEGRWIIYADWIDGSRYGERFTKSQAFTLTVQPRPSLMILFIRALPIAVVVIGILATMAFLAVSHSRRSKI